MATVGVFDSGLGGLTVLSKLVKAMPEVDFIYLGDNARLPYGTKSQEAVTQYSVRCTQFLFDQKIDALVLACNTATAMALSAVRLQLACPVFGVIEPGVQAALDVTQGSVLVLATESTVRSEAYVKNFHHRAPWVRVQSKACSMLVSLAEEGWCDHPITVSVIQEYLKGVRESYDTVVLGCTHYPLLLPSLKKALPAGVECVHGAGVLADQLVQWLKDRSLLTPSSNLGVKQAASSQKVRLFSTDRVRVSGSILELLPPAARVFEHVNL